MTTRTRLIVTLVFGLLFGAGTLSSLFVGDDSGDAGTAVVIGFLLLLVGVGVVVRRWFVVLAVLGPLIGLAILEVIGVKGNGEEWSDKALLSPPAIAGLVWLALLLLLGVWLGNVGEWFGRWRRRRSLGQ
jgi:hypothetical protein